MTPQTKLNLLMSLLMSFAMSLFFSGFFTFLAFGWALQRVSSWAGGFAVGWPGGPLQGRSSARGFYDRIISNVQTDTVVATRRYYGEDFCVQEHQ